MYAVSDEYLNKMRRPDVKRVLRGHIGGTLFTAADIVKDTLSISDQCAESGEIKLGSVYTATLECTFRNGLVERETWKGLQIEVSEGIYLEDGETIEYVPLGIFFVDEAIHGEQGVSVTAYDAMLLFEKSMTTDTTYGTPFELASLACQSCGVELENTKAQMEQFPNGTEELWLYAGNDIETWRDYLFWIGQTCGGFWTINRFGKLELRSYGMTVNASVSSRSRDKNASFSDFVTAYSGISVVKADTNEAFYYALPQDDGLSYDLGANPFLQDGTETDRERRCMAILGRLAIIEYVPFEARVLHGAAYELGDVLHFTGGRADDEKVCCVMLWEYDGKGFELEGFGTNPAVAGARSKVDKQLQGMLKSSQKDEIQFYRFVNSEEIYIADGDQKVITDLRYAALTKTVVQFQLEALVHIETTVEGIDYNDVKLQVTYTLNDMSISDYKPKETWTEITCSTCFMFWIWIRC